MQAGPWKPTPSIAEAGELKSPIGPLAPPRTSVPLLPHTSGRRGAREAPGVETIGVQMGRAFEHYARDLNGVARHQHRPHRPPHDREGAPGHVLLRPPLDPPRLSARQRLAAR